MHYCAVAVRDKRREGQLVGGTNKKHMVTYEVDVTEKTEVWPCSLCLDLDFPYIHNYPPFSGCSACDPSATGMMP